MSKAAIEQGELQRGLGDRLHFAEVELRLAVDQGGLDQRAAGKLVKMIRDLQQLRLGLRGEAPRPRTGR